MTHTGAAGDLLLFRAVPNPPRRRMAGRLLDDSLGSCAWRGGGEPDLWEMHDASSAPDEEPAAVAATWPLGDGRRVRLVGIAVAPSLRQQGLGRRLLEELSHALRRTGVLVLVSSVPSDHATALMVVQRAGFRPSHVERACAGIEGGDVVWFDLQL